MCGASKTRTSFKYFLCCLILIFCSCKSGSYFTAGHLIPAGEEPIYMNFTSVKGLIVINAEINGLEGRFILDNGFSLSAVDRTFAERAGMHFNSQVQATDANNKKATLPKTSVDTVRIGSRQFVNTGFYQIDTRKFLPCEKIDGVIGASIINKINWEINFRSKSLAISSRPFHNPGFTMDIVFKENNATEIPLNILGEALHMKVDLGSTTHIKIKKSKVEEAIKGDSAVITRGIRSLSATGLGNPDIFYELATRRVLKYKGRDLPLPGGILLTENLKNDGYIGIDYLNDYILTINSSNKQYILSEPKADPGDFLDDFYRIKIYKVGESWKIIACRQDSVDYGTSLLLKNISQVDGIDMINFPDICAFQEYIQSKKHKGESFTVTLENTKDAISIPFSAPRPVLIPGL